MCSGTYLSRDSSAGNFIVMRVKIVLVVLVNYLVALKGAVYLVALNSAV